VHFVHSSSYPDKPLQSLAEHLNQTASIAGEYSPAFNANNFGFICGQLYDLGKYSSKIQENCQAIFLRLITLQSSIPHDATAITG